MSATLSAVRSLWRSLSAGTQRWVAFTAGAHLLSRVSLVAVASTLALVGPAVQVAEVIALSGVLLATRLGVGRLRRASRRSLTEVAIHRVLGADVDAILAGSEDLSGLVFEGIFVGRELISSQLPSFVGDALAVAALALASVALLPIRVIALVVLGVVLVTLAAVVSRKAIVRASAAEQEAETQLYEALADATDGRLELVGNGCDVRFRSGVLGTLERWERASNRSAIVSAASGWGPMLVVACTAATLYFLRTRPGGLGGAMGEIAYFAPMAATVPVVLGFARGLLELPRQATRLRSFMALLGAPARWEGGPSLPPAMPSPIEARGLSFTFDPRQPPLLRDVTFKWAPGEVLLLRGANGAGKSTLLRLLLALAQPSAGRILAAGQDLSTLNASSWRGQTAYLAQKPYVPDRMTVRQAIALFVPDASDPVIRDALARVGLMPVLLGRGVPDALAIRVGTLSAGQRQRLALARVCCRRAKLIFLDEPDANLDAAGIEMLRGLVRELSKGAMVALVAHASELADVGDVVVHLPSDSARVPLPSPGATAVLA